MKSIKIAGIPSICKSIGLNWGIGCIMGKCRGAAEAENENAA